MENTSTSAAPRKVLVGIDGSASASAALRWASGLCQQDGGVISAVIAWNHPTAWMMPVVGMPMLPADYAAASARDTLRSTVAAVGAGEVTIEEQVVMGPPRSVLTEASEDSDVLVLGRTGNSRLKHAFVGSTVSYCIRHAACPVVIVRESIALERSITVAVDGSPTSIEALVWALELGGDRDVLAVYSHNDWCLEDLAYDERVRAELDVRAEAMLDEAVRAALDRTGADKSRVTRQVLAGDPRTAIVERSDPDALLVLGSQGHSGLARWVLGSLADYAVRHANGTVVVWRS